MSQGNISDINKFRHYAVQNASCLEIKCMDVILRMSIFSGQVPLTQPTIHPPPTLHVLGDVMAVKGFIMVSIHAFSSGQKRF